MADDLLESTFAAAYKEAEERKAAAEEAATAKAAAAAQEAPPLIYDPHRYPDSEPHDTRMYEGTGIGALYGLPGCEHLLAELGEWTLGEEPA